MGGDFMNVIVYSTTTCPYCKMLKDYFGQHNIAFTEKLVDQDDSAREEMMTASGGFLGVPFTIVAKDDGVKENVIGFDKGKLDGLLGVTA
jgi:glutaredoxin 3